MSDDADPPRDFERMLDLDRSTLIRDFVDEMEGRMREIETAQAALRDIVEAAARQEFPPRDGGRNSFRPEAAMKSVEEQLRPEIARLRLKDQIGRTRSEPCSDLKLRPGAAAQQELEALGRIGSVGSGQAGLGPEQFRPEAADLRWSSAPPGVLDFRWSKAPPGGVR